MCCNSKDNLIISLTLFVFELNFGQRSQVELNVCVYCYDPTNPNVLNLLPILPMFNLCNGLSSMFYAHLLDVMCKSDFKFCLSSPSPKISTSKSGIQSIKKNTEFLKIASALN